MPISYTCANCQHTGRVPDTLAGKRIKCPSCQEVTTIAAAPAARPKAAPRRAEVEEEAPALLRGGGRAGAAGPREQAAKAGVSPAVWVGGGVGAAALALVIGAVVLSQGGKEKPKAQGQAPTAATVPAADEGPAATTTPEPDSKGQEASSGSSPAIREIAQVETTRAPNSSGVEAPAATVQRIKDAAVYLMVKSGRGMSSGSGFVVRVDGDSVLVATNHHVIAGHADEGGANTNAPAARPAVNVTAVLRSGRGPAQEQALPGTVIAWDREGNRDLAIVRVAGVKNPPRPIDLAQKAELFETMPVLIFGFPFGNIDQMLGTSSQGNPSMTINKGSVSSLRMNEFNEVAYVQIDGSLNPGNSGGPVVDTQGRLVGVAVAQISNTTIGFAVPTHELTKMLDGRIGQPNLVLRAETSGTAEIQAQAKLIDPLNKIKGVSLLYLPADAKAPLPKPNADGTWSPMTGATKVDLAINSVLGSASFKSAVNGPAGRHLLVQAAYRDASGRVVYSHPVPFDVPTKPGALTAEGTGAAQSVKLKPSFAVLGPLISADKTCKLTRSATALTITVPGGLHLDSPELSTKNAPMVLADAENDFIAQVKVAGNMVPGTEAAMSKGRRLPFTFQGAGLLLWQDKDNYFRLERTAGTAGKSPALVTRLLLEICKNGRPAGHFYLNVPEGPLYLRIARLNGALQCMFGPDGKTWVVFQKLAVVFPPKLKIGLSAGSTSAEPLTARFEEFVLISEPAKSADEKPSP